MNTTMLYAALALLGIAMSQQAVACDYTHTTAAQTKTVVACAGDKCQAQQPATAAPKAADDSSNGNGH